jgi:protein-disulfide isomerase
MKKTLATLSAAVAVALLSLASAVAQTSMPPGQATPIKDASALRPPAGSRVAIVEFEDLECPHCGYAAPMVRAAAEKHHIPYLHHDFPIHVGVWWSLSAAITARILEDTVSPQMAEQFRLDVYSNQTSIVTEEDLSKFTQQWFAKHKLGQPFTMDPKFREEVMADAALAQKLGLAGTPAIFVVTQKGWIQVTDPLQMDAAIAKAEEMAK